MREANRRRRAVLGTVLAVLLVGGGAAVLGRSSHSSPPSVLRLAATAAPRADAALATGTKTGGDFELVGALPTAHPDTPAWSVTSAARTATVTALATALEAGTPVKDGSGWRTDKGLVVNPDGSWWWSACADGVVSSDGVTSRCAVASGTATSGSGVSSGEPGSTAASAPSTTVVTPEPPTPGAPKTVAPETARPVPAPRPVPTADQDTVLSTAGPVLAAVGLDVGDARVDGSTAVVDPVVGGLPTYGVSTRVAVNADGTVSYASGWLFSATKGETYPLLTAREAFDELPALPRPMLACPVTPSGEGCLPLQPVQVTGARLGLALHQLVNGDPVLVPAWLFQVRGWTDPVPGLAVEPRYLGVGPTPEPSMERTSSGRPVPPPSTVPEPATAKPSA